MNTSLLRVIRLGLCLLALSLSFVSQVHAADPAASASSSLIIAYHVAPANRAAFRDEWEKNELRRFQQWQDEGVLTSYQVLFSRYADSDNWDALAMLNFAGAPGLTRWKLIERDRPAGLSPKALALTSAIHSVPVDKVRGAGAAEEKGSPVFMVIPYATLVSAAEYLKYADGYVIPQFEGWMQEGVLAQYAVYAGNFPAGRPWSTLVLLEYRSEQALAARNAVVAKVRSRLKDKPEWKAISDNKMRVRDEKQLVVADLLVLK